MTSITTPRLLAVVALAAGATALPAAAQAGTVKSAHLDWTQTNVYDLAGAKTWLGYATSKAPVNAQGTAAPIAPATGDTVTPDSPKGPTATSTTVFPGTSGTYDATDGTGTIELAGGLSYIAPAPPAGHGFDISVEQPKLVLNGLSGQLYASGKRSPANGDPNPSATYDRGQAVFNLDLSAATVTLKADGSRVISGIAPSLAGTGYAFPGQYAAGAGPDRDPNTFGTFTLTVKTNGGDTGPQGPAGANGKDGATGPAGRNGTSATIRTVKAVLAKAPYKGSATRKVTIYSIKNAKLATGTLKGRVLKVTLAGKVTSLSGKVKVKVTGAKTAKTVSIPS